jgi:GntR family transcriptional repressor for pyruvate dehydrogenase complex
MKDSRRRLAPRKNSVGQDVIEQIKELVRNNNFPPGSRLPPERDLAQLLGVSRPSVREAVGTLALMGILDTRHGSGTTVADTGTNLLRAPFEFLMMLDRPSIYELYEVRELVEVHLAGRAAERRTIGDLEAIRLPLEAMRKGFPNPVEMQEPNVEFHMAIAQAAQMSTLAKFMECLHDGVIACTQASREGVLDWHASVEIHEEIFDAIVRQNATDARHAMMVHMAMAVGELRRQERKAVLEGSPRP